jgi:adenosylcobinamide-GDP ribazoletransferase
MGAGELRVFFTALGFFTRIPVPAWVGYSPELLASAPRYLPLVGLLVGLAGGLVTELAALVLHPWVAIVLGMIATVWLTGALHEDGFADTCDGLGGGWTKDQALAIMKDSRIGSYGAIGLVLVLLLKYQALQQVDSDVELFDGAFDEGLSALLPALVAAHGVSRLVVLGLMASLDYARSEDSRAAPLAHRPGPVSLAFAALCALAPCVLLPLPQVLFALGGSLMAGLAAWRWFHRRLGGYTGDCLGAAQQVAEVAFYLGLGCSFI